MWLSNPFIVILVIMAAISLSVAAYMDGADMPPRKYNFWQVFWGTALHFVLIFLAINWALTHS